MDCVTREEQERVADGWAAEAKSVYASNGHIEMPELGEEPYFGPMVKRYLKLVTEKSPPEWALNHQEMITSGVFYRNKSAGIEIRGMQEYYELALRGLDGDEFGRRLNDCVKKEYPELYTELEEKTEKEPPPN